MQLKKYNIKGEEAGSFEFDATSLENGANGQMVKDYIVALRANLRQWSANTKGRSEVNHSTRKPYKQKGTGNARQGTLAAPQFRGGGIVFGPKPKFDQKVNVNKREKRASLRTLLQQKINSDAVIIVDDQAFHSQLETPKTKLVADFLKKRGVYGRKVLFVVDGEYEKFEDYDGEEVKISVRSDRHDIYKKSLRNIPEASFAQAANVNGYELLVSHAIFFTESAFKQLIEVIA